MPKNDSPVVIHRLSENTVIVSENHEVNIEEQKLAEIESLAFDPIFYRNYYKDLAAMPNDRALALHFIQFGRDEGRSPNAAALI